MTAWILEKTMLCFFLSKRIAACVLEAGTINRAHARWSAWPNKNPFAAICIGFWLSPCVEFKNLQSQPSVKPAVPVQALYGSVESAILNKHQRKPTHVEILGVYFIGQANTSVSLGILFLSLSSFCSEFSGTFFWYLDVLVCHGIWSILHPFCSGQRLFHLYKPL